MCTTCGRCDAAGRTLPHQTTGRSRASYKRLRFCRSSEKLDAAQANLLDETLDADQAAIGEELRQLRPPPKTDHKQQQPRRTLLPAHLPRVDGTTSLACSRSSVMFAAGGLRKCQTLIQASAPARVIDKGIPISGLLAQVMVAKYADHLPLYAQEAILGRAGLAISRSLALSRQDHENYARQDRDALTRA